MPPFSCSDSCTSVLTAVRLYVCTDSCTSVLYFLILGKSVCMAVYGHHTITVHGRTVCLGITKALVHVYGRESMNGLQYRLLVLIRAITAIS